MSKVTFFLLVLTTIHIAYYTDYQCSHHRTFMIHHLFIQIYTYLYRVTKKIHVILNSINIVYYIKGQIEAILFYI